MEDRLLKTHHRFTSIADVVKVSKYLNDNTDYINFMGCGRVYDNGHDTYLTTNKDWLEYYSKKHLYNTSITKKKLKTGINYWKQNKNQQITEIMEYARDNLDIAARIDFISRDEINKCYHLFSFYSKRKHEDKAYSFYGMHAIKLIKFISYFTQKAAYLIAEANKPENHIVIPNYTPPNLPEKTRDFVTEMKAVGATYKLGDREAEALLLYAAGYTAKQIGEMFHRSPKTIENHLDRIKKKTGCKDRKDLHAYVRDIGLVGMEQFFFNYFTHK